MKRWRWLAAALIVAGPLSYVLTFPAVWLANLSERRLWEEA